MGLPPFEIPVKLDIKTTHVPDIIRVRQDGYICLKLQCMLSNDPLHGKTLEQILTELVHSFGWEHLGQLIKINCFLHEPSINSSLKFLRKTPWARKKVEELYIKSHA